MSEHTPFLSIIVPAYNVQEYIVPCVESILQQTYKDYELILVDDGSQDETGKICDEYEKKESKIKVIHKVNGGLVSARKSGVREAIGEYVMYVDGDDWIKQNALELMCNKAVETSADIIIADLVSVGKKDQKLLQNMKGGYYSGANLEKIFYPNMLSTGEYFSFGIQPSLCGRLFRREILIPIQLRVNETIRLGEDAACSYPCFLAARSLYYMKGEHLYCYRMRQSSISHSIIKTYYTKEIIALAEQMEKEFNKYPDIADKLDLELCYYIIYMIENMFTPNLTLKSLLFSNTFRDEIKIFGNSQIGKKVCQFVKMNEVSGRAKRIIRVMEKNSLSRRLNLFLFYKYEMLKSKV